jgi:hypothetical protein
MPGWMRRTGTPTRILASVLLCELLRSCYGYVYFPGRAFGLSYSTSPQGPVLFHKDLSNNPKFAFSGVNTETQAINFLTHYGFVCREETFKPFADQPERKSNICRSTEHKPFVWFPAPEWIANPGTDGTLSVGCKCFLYGS